MEIKEFFVFLSNNKNKQRTSFTQNSLEQYESQNHNDIVRVAEEMSWDGLTYTNEYFNKFFIYQYPEVVENLNLTEEFMINNPIASEELKNTIIFRNFLFEENVNDVSEENCPE